MTSPGKDEFIRLVREAAGLDLSRLKLSSPASDYVKLNAAAAFAVSLAHERRHMWQARNVGEELETAGD